MSQNKKKGSKFEGKVQRSINSGATWLSPLDLRSDKYCIECKFTDKPGYRITLDLLEKIWGQSLSMCKEPVLSIGIKRNDDQIFVLTCNISIEKREGIK